MQSTHHPSKGSHPSLASSEKEQLRHCHRDGHDGLESTTESDVSMPTRLLLWKCVLKCRYKWAPIYCSHSHMLISSVLVSRILFLDSHLIMFLLERPKWMPPGCHVCRWIRTDLRRTVTYLNQCVFNCLVVVMTQEWGRRRAALN